MIRDSIIIRAQLKKWTESMPKTYLRSLVVSTCLSSLALYSTLPYAEVVYIDLSANPLIIHDTTSPSNGASDIHELDLDAIPGADINFGHNHQVGSGNHRAQGQMNLAPGFDATEYVETDNNTPTLLSAGFNITEAATNGFGYGYIAWRQESTSFGEWYSKSANVRGFLGYETAGGHLGWIDIEAQRDDGNFNNNANDRLIIHGYAYESVPGVPIAAGNTHSVTAAPDVEINWDGSCTTSQVSANGSSTLTKTYNGTDYDVRLEGNFNIFSPTYGYNRHELPAGFEPNKNNFSCETVVSSQCPNTSVDVRPSSFDSYSENNGYTDGFLHFPDKFCNGSFQLVCGWTTDDGSTNQSGWDACPGIQIDSAEDKGNHTTGSTDTCKARTDYADHRCGGIFRVSSPEDLEDYVSSDFGRDGGSRFKHLSIVNNLDQSGDNLIIESPCTIRLGNGVALTADTIELDGRTGVQGGRSNTLTAPIACLLSEQGHATLGADSVVTADELTVQAAKTAKVGRASDVLASEALIVESTGNFGSSSAVIDSNSKVEAGILDMSASRTISLGHGAAVTATTIKLSSTGANSDAEIKSGATVNAGELAILANRMARIDANTTVTVTSHLDMDAAAENRCRISRSANVSFSTKSGVCATVLP